MPHKHTNKVFLHPGEFWFGDADLHVHTLLGSCVSISLWHPQKHIGGLCHFVLPTRPQMGGPGPDGRYGDEAMELFRRSAFKHGTQLQEYEAKIFGGSNMLGAGAGSEEDLVGTRNAEAAMQLLSVAGCMLMVAHVGESGHRRLVFEPRSGDVWVRHQADDGHRVKATSGVS